ncbi:MAG: cyclopropane fatty acyl phospholipid synthase [Patescibacteria group bacterium]
MTLNPEQATRDILQKADITIGGDKPGDIRVNDQRFYGHVMRGGSLGLGESYMDGWWDANELDTFFTKLLRSDEIRKDMGNYLPAIVNAYVSHVVNRQEAKRSLKSVQAHYDIGNDLYTRMLDKRMAYTCGYWNESKNLDDAQEAKFDLVCRKIGLKPGMTVLDLGCGWGCFSKFAAEKYGAKVLGVTLSKEQVALGMEMCKGLPVELRLQDYRDVSGTYDRVVSVGLMEHVGYKNYREFFEVISRSMKDETSVALVHTIGGSISSTSTDPWLDKYIFPNSMLPSVAQIAKAMEGLFVMEDWHNFGADYDKTLMAWYDNFMATWKEIEPKYGERFRRMWEYYLLCCAGTFRSRYNQLWQVVISKKGVPGGYKTVR